jgi:hypothetical protein
MNHTYYHIKSFIPRRIQIILRRRIVLRKRHLCAGIWPLDRKASKSPDGWSGWPEGKRFALVLTHDVETAKGQEKCIRLARLEESMGFRSSFNFVPEGYKVSSELRHDLSRRGFEVGVHGLKHDGKLYKSEEIFRKSAKKINSYLKEWQSVGFRSPSMHHNLDWIHNLNIEYDASTFDTDPFEPQPEGVGTLFPFLVQNDFTQKGYVELPYTLPQDFTLFVLMREKTIDVWKRKLDWIVERGGMALLITHPDYMAFKNREVSVEEYPAEYYKEFLMYIRDQYEGEYWHALPKELSSFWKSNLRSGLK